MQNKVVSIGNDVINNALEATSISAGNKTQTLMYCSVYIINVLEINVYSDVNFPCINNIESTNRSL